MKASCPFYLFNVTLRLLSFLHVCSDIFLTYSSNAYFPVFLIE